MLQPGSRFGRYRVDALLGHGGMGAVYRAWDESLQRPVALKVLVDADHEAAVRLQREARAASALNHPHICTVYEVGEADGRPYIAMELVDGRPLDRMIPAGGLPLETVVRIGRQLAQALAHAHDAGVVHRDMKAANVVVSQDGHAKVLDFGLASTLPRADAEAVTRTTSLERDAGALVGTLPYMAPETLRGEPATPESDIWALGVVLHEMASGIRPFDGASAADLIAAVLREPVSRDRLSVSPALDGVIRRCLAKEPAQRYRHAREIDAVLESLADAPADRPHPRAHSPVERRSWPRWAGVVLMSAVVLAIFAQWRPADEGTPESNQRLLVALDSGLGSASFSPAGDAIAYLDADDDGRSQVWVRRLDGGAPLQVTDGPVPAGQPAWARDGEIVFGRQGAGIWSVSPLGGTARQLLDRGANPSVAVSANLIAYEVGTRIWVAGLDGSDARIVEGVPARRYSLPYRPAISPDGTRIAFFRTELGPNGDLWVIPAAGGDATRLTSDVREGGTPVWTPDGRSVIFSSARAGSRTLWRIDADGGTPEPVTVGTGEDSEPAISPDGSQLIYTNVRNTWILRMFDPATGDHREIHEARFGILWPMFSPDGGRIAFFGPNEEGDAQVFVIGADGSDVRQVTDAPGEMNTMPAWFADGEALLVYKMYPEMSLDRVPIASGAAEPLFPWSWNERNFARFSPDGTHLAYTEHTGFRPTRTVVRDMRTGIEHALEQAIRMPRWSPDGSELLGHAGATVVRCEVAGGGCSAVTQGQVPKWSGDGQSIYLFRDGSGPAVAELWRVGRDGTGEERLTVLGPFRTIDVHFDVSPDDQIVWTEFRGGRPELWMADLR